MSKSPDTLRGNAFHKFSKLLNLRPPNVVPEDVNLLQPIEG